MQQQLDVLRGEITHAITSTRLQALISDQPIRVELFAETVWGTIQWPKALGRPITPTLAAAFKIEHIAWQVIVWGSQEAPMSQEIALPTAPLSIWDGPNDRDHYRVTFMGRPSLRENAINVSFAAGVGWEKPVQVIPGYRILSPSGIAFHHLEGKRTVLEPFNVINKPFLAP
ncbi:MAG: hypothetical protein JWN02_2167 [Acidobacteria bacterium]|nr:hypothetical protein [Acidobacteriota bacterium]